MSLFPESYKRCRENFDKHDGYRLLLKEFSTQLLANKRQALKEINQSSGSSSQENFRLEWITDVKRLESTDRPELEKKWEKGVALANDPAWYNAMPVCSGVSSGDSKRQVDLIHLPSRGPVSLIELKVTPTTNGPLSAALEIAGYAIVVDAARKARYKNKFIPNGGRERKRLPDVGKVMLEVLAPSFWYDHNGRRGVAIACEAKLEGLMKKKISCVEGFKFAEVAVSKIAVEKLLREDFKGSGRTLVDWMNNRRRIACCCGAGVL